MTFLNKHGTSSSRWKDKKMIGSALVLDVEILGCWINSKTCWLVLHEINHAKKQIRFLGFVRNVKVMRHTS